MRIFSAAIVTETNTFSPIPTGQAEFDVIRPADLSTAGKRKDASIETFRHKATEEGHELIFSFSAFAQPAGLTLKKVYEQMRDEMLEDLRAAMPVDIVLLPLHGAMVADGYDDCEEDIVSSVRATVGPDVVIGVELDLHCHLGEKLIADADLIVIYKEYPHTDIGLRAAELFDLALATARGEIEPTMAIFDCRMVGMYFTPFEPMRSFVDEMSTAEGKEGVLSLSLAHGFPWGDVPHCGTRMLAITDNDLVGAEQVAETFGRKFFAMREAVSFEPLSLDEALEKALSVQAYPVVIADQADNAGGGAPSDSTYVLAALLERKLTNVALGMMYDPGVVQLAKSAGVGASLTVRLGGKMGVTSGEPLDLTTKVIGVIDAMTQRWPQDGEALVIDCGDAAALEVDGITIIVNSKRSQVFSPDVFTNFGIDVSQKRLLVVKSIQHFYAGFEPVASEIIYTAAPGAVAPIMTDIPYKRVDLKKFPWIDDPFAS